jgi:hypothetical protein
VRRLRSVSGADANHPLLGIHFHNTPGGRPPAGRGAVRRPQRQWVMDVWRGRFARFAPLPLVKPAAGVIAVPPRWSGSRSTIFVGRMGSHDPPGAGFVAPDGARFEPRGVVCAARDWQARRQMRLAGPGLLLGHFVKLGLPTVRALSFLPLVTA